MLCVACKDVVCGGAVFGFGNFQPWKQTPQSFCAALEGGCHLCNLIYEHACCGVEGTTLDMQKCGNITYAFRALNEGWARSGKGIKWMSEQNKTSDEGRKPYDEWVYAKSLDNRMKAIGMLLTEHPEELLADETRVWMVLEFVGDWLHVSLPIDVFKGEESESFAQILLDLQRNTGSEQTLSLASTWLSTCVSNHADCKPVYHDAHWLPTRLIFLGSLSHPELRLVVGDDLDSNVTYLTLSYTWGDKNQTRLQTSSLSGYFDAIPPETICGCVKDAILVTRHLGFQYLWIDRFCILQDDELDWERESALMSKVYGHSTCTIAAACSTAGEGFLRDRNQYAIRPLKIDNPFARGRLPLFQVMSQYLGPIFEKDVKETTWYGRSWVFQERLLSQRMLIFTKKQVIWACQKLQASESCPRGRTSEYFIDRFESFEVEKLRLKVMLQEPIAQERRESKNPWHTIISEYTKTQTSRKADRLFALEGIANRIQQQISVKYVCGLWCDETLSGYLLWHVVPEDLRPRPTEHRCSSWSWGSVDSPVQFYDDFHAFDYQYIHNVSPDDRPNRSADSITRHKATLNVSGPMIRVYIHVEMLGGRMTVTMYRDRPNFKQTYANSSDLEVCSTPDPASQKTQTARDKVATSLARFWGSILGHSGPCYIVLVLIGCLLRAVWELLVWILYDCFGYNCLSHSVYEEIHLCKAWFGPQEPSEIAEDTGLQVRRTHSIEDGTAYRLAESDLARYRMELYVRKAPDPTINAKCYLDSISYSAGTYAVDCLVVAHCATSHEYVGLLLLSLPGSRTTQTVHNSLYVPHFMRMGTFSCADREVTFKNCRNQRRNIKIM